MRAVVTGATSFLGAALIRRLLEEGHQVYAVVRPHSANRKVLPENVPGLRVLALDMERLLELPGQIGDRCEVYFHFAWDGSGSANRKRQEIQEKNAKDSVNALKGARALGCRRFLFSGSQAEYGQCKDRMWEGRECRPVSWYGLAKTEFYRQAQKLCQGWKDEGKETLEYIHARIFSVYGPGDHPGSLVNSCLDAFLKGGVMELGACTQLWNYLYIEDLVNAFMALVDYPGELEKDGLYNIAGEASWTRPLKDYVEEMRRLCGGRGECLYGKLPPNAEGPANLIPDISRMKAIGWRPSVSFEEGIGRILREKGKDRKANGKR